MTDHVAGRRGTDQPRTNQRDMSQGAQVPTQRNAERTRPPMPTVGDVMSERVVSLPPAAKVTEAAQLMRDEHVGTVLINGETGEIRGLVTDRDLVLRVLGAGLDPNSTMLDSICSRQVITVETTLPAHTAMRLMREHLIRRLPVVDISGQAVGVVSIGDLAITTEPTTAVADISAAPPNDR